MFLFYFLYQIMFLYNINKDYNPKDGMFRIQPEYGEFSFFLSANPDIPICNRGV